MYIEYVTYYVTRELASLKMQIKFFKNKNYILNICLIFVFVVRSVYF